MPLAAVPRHLIALIERAFGGEGLEGRASLVEGELIGDYPVPARTKLDPPPIGLARDSRGRSSRSSTRV